MAWFAKHPFGEQDENGFDLGRLRENRRLAPAERIAKFEAFRRFVLATKKAAGRPKDERHLMELQALKDFKA